MKNTKNAGSNVTGLQKAKLQIPALTFKIKALTTMPFLLFWSLSSWLLCGKTLKLLGLILMWGRNLFDISKFHRKGSIYHPATMSRNRMKQNNCQQQSF